VARGDKGKRKMNEIDKIIQEGIGDETIGENESAKWLRRRLRALVRKAYICGRKGGFTYANRRHSRFFEMFGFCPTFKKRGSRP
jgi:hypothetical protein